MGANVMLKENLIFRKTFPSDEIFAEYSELSKDSESLTNFREY